MRPIAIFFSLVLAGKAWGTGEINVLTDLLSPFPPGCVALSLPDAPASGDNELWDDTVFAPGIGSGALDHEVRIRIWRMGCADEGFSIVLVRLEKVSGSRPVLIPQIFVDAGLIDPEQGEVPFHEGQLIPTPAVGNIGASGNVLVETGQTFMVAASPLAIDEATEFTTADYNDLFTLEFFWGGYAPGIADQGELFPIAAYEPALDPPQFDIPLLHGRMNGAYVFEGKPSTGLFLNIGENFDGLGLDDNFVFAAFFTYLNGEPFWTVGSPGTQDPGVGVITIPMVALSGGDFFTNPPSYTDADLTEQNVGDLTIEVLDCNTLRLDYDFRPIGQGTGSLQAQRLIRIAGYDCNPWR